MQKTQTAYKIETKLPKNKIHAELGDRYSVYFHEEGNKTFMSTLYPHCLKIFWEGYARPYDTHIKTWADYEKTLITFEVPGVY